VNFFAKKYDNTTILTNTAKMSNQYYGIFQQKNRNKKYNPKNHQLKILTKLRPLCALSQNVSKHFLITKSKSSGNLI
jgi:hypothetical protein